MLTSRHGSILSTLGLSRSTWTGSPNKGEWIVTVPSFGTTDISKRTFWV